MDVKIGLINIFLSHELQEFGNTSVRIVDANGNVLLNFNKRLEKFDEQKCKLLKDKIKRDGKISEMNAFGAVANDMDLDTKDDLEGKAEDKDVTSEEHQVTEEDMDTISRLLDGYKSQTFTTKLSKSNYICFLDGQGLLTCRGRFNVETQSDRHTFLESVKNEYSRNQSQGKRRLNKPATVLAACKASEMLVVVSGESNSKRSMVELVKQIGGVLNSASSA